MIVYVYLLIAITGSLADNPCRIRAVSGESVLCVCNAKYCDTIEREEPANNSYVSYTSSQGGFRFIKSTGSMKEYNSLLSEDVDTTLELDSCTSYQTIQGFGGAVTDSAAIIWKNLTQTLQQTLIESYFGATGIEYSFIRVPIGGSDFSTHPYAYNELPENDVKLTNFSLTSEDYDYKIPMIKAAGAASRSSVQLLATTWSPPRWMKTNDDWTGFSMLKTEYYQTYADYHLNFQKNVGVANDHSDTENINVLLSGQDDLNLGRVLKDFHRNSGVNNDDSNKENINVLLSGQDDLNQKNILKEFLQQYAEAGVSVWGITTTNEPFNGVIPIVRFNSMGWTPSTMGKWIAENLGPTIRNSTFKDVKILSVDDQRFMIPIWFNWAIKKRPEVLDWIDGVAIHWYGDFLTPASALQLVTQKHPDKFLLATEACSGFLPFEKGVLLGSWSRAEDYVRDIIEDLNQSMVGWIDWNLCLDTEGGPNWSNNLVDSPIIVDTDAQEFVKQPMFYAMGHFSKFVPRGSKRIGMETTGKEMETVAFMTPMGTVVVVVLNEKEMKSTVRLRVKDKEIVLTLPEKSVTTVELSQDVSACAGE